MSGNDPRRSRRRSRLLVGLLLRGVVFRRGLSLALFVAAALTAAAAAIGPTYAQGAAESTLRDQLESSPAQTVGLRLTRTDSGSPDVLLQEGSELPFVTPSSMFGHARPIPSIEWRTGSFVQSGEALTSTVVSRPGFCSHVVIVSGRCPSGAHEVVASARSFSIPDARWRSGRTLQLDDGVRVQIVGSYRPRDVDDPFWFGDVHFAQGPDASGGIRTDDLFASPELTASLPQTVTVRSTNDYPLLPDRIRLADVPRLRADLRDEEDGGALSVDVRLDTGLGDVLDAADHERSLVAVGTLLVCLQLGLLGLLVLFQIASDVAEARGPDIAIAKLRGHSPFRVLRFGLGETVVLLLAATPTGIALGVLAATLLGGAVFAPGTPVESTGWTFGAGAIALLGGLVAVALAASRVLTRPVTAQWRRTRGPGRASRLALILDGAILLLAVIGLLVLRTVRGGATGSAGLLAPGLLVLAVALVGVRLLPVVLRPLLPATRASARVGLLLAVRQVVRRPAGIRLATLLAVAVGLATFGVGGQAAAVDNRAARAAAEVGASRVLRVQTGDGIDPVRAVRLADPDGRWAMAAATWLPDGGDSVLGTVLAVDPARLDAVAEPARGGLTNSALARALAAPAVPAIRVQGTRLTATITATGIRPGLAPQVRFELLDRLGRDAAAEAATLRNGTADYSAAIHCTAGCTLTGITWLRPTLADGDVRGTATVSRLTQAGGRSTTVAAGLHDPRAWRAAVPVSEARDDVSAGRDGVRDAFSGESGYGGIASAAQPRVLPAVSTAGGLIGGVDPRHGKMQDASGTTVAFRASSSSRVLPRVLAEGVLVDAEQLGSALPGFTGEASWEVWLSADAPNDAVQRIRAAGLPVESVTTAADRAAALGRQGPALAFLLLVASALAGAVLAAIGTVVTISASARRRSYELAALKVIGVPRRRLLAASLLEQLFLLGTATLLGVPGGFVAGLLALPVIPEFGTATPVELYYVPGVAAVAAFTVAFGLFVLGAAAIATLDLLRRAVPGRLREAEE